MDRFSCPLDFERVNPYHLECMIKEQQQENKIRMIDQYISMTWDMYSLLPDAEEVQEHFYKLELDLELIEERLRLFT